MDFFKINSKTIRSPTEITVSQEVLDKTERTMDGTMVVDVIGKKDKVDVTWDYLPDADLKLLSAEIRGSVFGTVTYNTAETSEPKTITARAEGLTYMPFYDWPKKRLLWQSVSVSFAER